MSMEPYDYSQFPPSDDDFDEPMQMHGGSSWQPGWRPPSRPACGPPPWPPGPGAGGWPFWGYWGFRLRSAWRDVKFLNKLIGDIINEQIDNGIIAPGPNYVPPPGSTAPPQTTGIKGVTDGSDAGPGMVGEFITGSAAISYPGSTTNTVLTVSPLVVQPGDWDLWASLGQFSGTIQGANFSLNPVPSGISNDMMAQWGGLAGLEKMVLGGPIARGSFSVPTLLAFTVNIGTSPSLNAGTATLRVEGRRRR